MEVNFLSEQAGIKNKDDSTGTDIYDLLKQDHNDVNNLLRQMVDSAKFDVSSYAQIKRMLKTHLAGEEKLLYSKLENIKEMRKLVLEAYEAHDLGKQIMIDIDMSENFSDDWLLAKIKLLSIAVGLHFREEENNLFDKAKNVFSTAEAIKLGLLFEQEKTFSQK